MRRNTEKSDQVGTRIRAIRTARGLSLYQLSKQTGLQYHTLQRIEQGEADPRVDTLLKVAQAVGVNPARFFEDQQAIHPPVSVSISSKNMSRTERNRAALVSLPLFRDAASLGSGREINERDIETYLVMPKAQVPNAGHCYCIKVAGDSMEPVFLSGDVVAVDFSQNDPSRLDRSFVACRLGDGDVSIKQLRVKDRYFHFKGTNSDWEDVYGPVLSLKRDGLILGRVVWLWRKF